MKTKEDKAVADKKDMSGMKFHLTKEGSLGILAYGDVAIQAWRKIKKA